MSYTYNTLHQLSRSAPAGLWLRRSNDSVYFIRKRTGTEIGFLGEDYCASCNGARKERIKPDTAGDVESWLRYEEQGNATRRIDEKYDSDDDGDIDEYDGWRQKQHTIQGPNGELVREVMYTYSSSTSATPTSTDEYYYGYDRIASIMNITDSDGDVVANSIFEQDAFGNEMNDSWLDDFTRHFGAHTWEEDEGLYHSEPYMASTGRSVSSSGIIDGLEWLLNPEKRYQLPPLPPTVTPTPTPTPGPPTVTFTPTPTPSPTKPTPTPSPTWPPINTRLPTWTPPPRKPQILPTICVGDGNCAIYINPTTGRPCGYKVGDREGNY